MRLRLIVAGDSRSLLPTRGQPSGMLTVEWIVLYTDIG